MYPEGDECYDLRVQAWLDWVDRLAPDHVSVYMLEVDEDSRLGRELLAGGVRYGAADVPSEELLERLTPARRGIIQSVPPRLAPGRTLQATS